MTGEPERYAQAQQKLGEFRDRVTKMPALIERPQPKREMYRGGGIERRIDDRNAPPLDVKRQPGFHQRVGNIAEGVIEEMRENVGEHDEAASEAHLPNPDAAQPIGNSRRPVRCGRAHVDNCWCQYRHEMNSFIGRIG